MGKYVYPCPIRWSDMDAYGHVNNAKYLTLFEEARTHLVVNAGRDSALASLLDGVVVASFTVHYRKPVTFQIEPLPITLWVSAVKRASFTMTYHIHRGGQLMCEASSVMVAYDLAEGKPRRLTSAESAALALYQPDA